MPTIERTSLREQVLTEIRRLILEGVLPAGSRIRETDLAERIGVSRTPVRESLHSLEREGLVRTDPGRGFFVRSLSAAEAQELYPLRALLEPLALRLADIPDPGRLETLGRMNRELGTIPKGAGWIDLDDRWHDLLVAACPNRHLLRMIENLRALTRRYEFAFLADTRSELKTSTTQNQEILANLASGDLDAACDLLADNMIVGVEPILRWLNERQPK